MHPKQHHGGGPEGGPQRHEDHEAGVFGLVPEEHHAEPAAQSPAQARHPQQRPLRDAAALALRLRLVHAVKDEAQEVNEDKVKDEEFRHIVKSSNWEGLAKIIKIFFALSSCLPPFRRSRLLLAITAVLVRPMCF